MYLYKQHTITILDSESEIKYLCIVSVCICSCMYYIVSAKIVILLAKVRTFMRSEDILADPYNFKEHFES